MTIPDWNIEDYVLDFEDVRYSGPIVKAPLIIKTGRILRYLHDLVFPDAIKAVASGGEVSGLLMGFSIVEYLAGYYAGKRSQAKDFISFLERYFPEEYKPLLSDIYNQLRNGLVHNLTLLNPWIPSRISFIIESRSESHLQLKDEKVVFSIYHFIEDTRRAMVMYLYDLIMKADENQDLIKLFEQRFNKQNGAASVMVKSD